MDDEPRDPEPADRPPPAAQEAQPPAMPPAAGPRSAPPRVWPTVLTSVAAVLLFLLTSILAGGIAVIVIAGVDPTADFRGNPIERLLSSRAGLLLVMVPPQVVLAAVAFLAALVSPLGVRRRLSLNGGNWPVWAWIAGVAATPLIATLSAAALSQLVEPSEQLEQLTDAFRRHARSGFLLPLLVVVGIVPGFCEEVFFRGYFQSRLAQRWGAAGVFIAALFFAVIHMDLVHGLAVFPLGLWLGFLAARAGSLWPAVLAHTANNVASVVSTIPEQNEMMEAPAPAFAASVFLVGVPALVLTLYAARRYPPPTTSDATRSGPRA